MVQTPVIYMQLALINQDHLNAVVTMGSRVMELFALISKNVMMILTIVAVPMLHAQMMYLDHILAAVILVTQEMERTVLISMSVILHHAILMQLAIILKDHFPALVKKDLKEMGQTVQM